MKTKVRSLVPDIEPAYCLDIVGLISCISLKPKSCYHAALRAEKAWIWLSTGMSLRDPKSLLVKFIFLPGHVPPPLRCLFPPDLKQRRTVHSTTTFAYYTPLLVKHWDRAPISSLHPTELPTHTSSRGCNGVDSGIRKSRIESQIVSRSRLKRGWGVSQTVGRLWGAYYTEHASEKEHGGGYHLVHPSYMMAALHEPVRHLESDIAIITLSKGLLKTFDVCGVTSCFSSSMASHWFCFQLLLSDSWKVTSSESVQSGDLIRVHTVEWSPQSSSLAHTLHHTPICLLLENFKDLWS